MNPSPRLIEEWFTKEQAAKLLGVSTRQVERLAAARKIEKRFLKPGQGRRYGRTEYLRTSLAMIEEERQMGIHITESARTRQDRSRIGIEEFLTSTVIPAAQRALAFVPPANKPECRAWFSLKDAAEYSGLEEDTLVSLIKGGFVKAIDQQGQSVSPGTRRASYRIQRASLDAYGVL